jgi:hypothetical protein
MHKAQWHFDIALLSYRCGGSIGLGKRRTDFPFNQWTFIHWNLKAGGNYRGVG